MRHYRHQRALGVLCPLGVLAAVALVTLSAANLEGQATATINTSPHRQECRRVVFREKPHWVLSGAWNKDESRLILSNSGPGQGSLLVYDRNGREYASPDKAVRSNGPTRFSVLRPATPGSYVLEGFPGEFFWITSDFKPAASINLRGAAPVRDLATRNQASAGLSLETALDWTYVEGREGERGYIVAFSDVKRLGAAGAKTEELWEGGFVSLRATDGRPQFTYLYEPQHHLYLRRYYVTGYQYFASVGRDGSSGKGYFVVMEASSFIQEFDPLNTEAPRKVSLLELGSHMKRFADPPSIPTLDSREEYLEAFRVIQDSAMVASLASDGDAPFVITREPKGESKVEWAATRIDPNTLSPQGVVYLPTEAAHVTIIPGRKQWAILEKGPVTDIATQSINSMVLVPSEWFSGAERFLATKERAMEACR